MSADDRAKTYLRRLTAELQATKRELSEERSRSTEPIAIVGMGCRFPGEADDPDAFWDFLAADGDGMGPIPSDRGWDLGALDAHEGVLEGAFLDAPYDFDPAFFGINRREALAMDPHQRLLLMTTWEAMERAGESPDTLRGASVGVFSGVMYQDYLSERSRPPEEIADYLSVGGSNSVVAGRLSYTFGFGGPALSVDTACSSSLVAVHLAVQSLRRGECDTAFASGAMIMSTPAAFESYVIDGALSDSGRCRAFSEDADGTAWGEGVGVLMLEPLSVAQERGHEVLAVIRGSAVNQDGRSSGLTAPNGPAQQRVIRAALRDAGLTAADVDVVEAHGTGTRLGDPIEAGALHAVYGHERTAENPLLLGSVKSNIGHTQAAAGVAGIIKMVQSLRHERLPRTLWVNSPSPRIDWDGTVRLLTEPQAWPAGDRVRRAGVSGFGFSGTNAHVILEEAPTAAEHDAPVSASDPVGTSTAPEASTSGPTPLVVTARTASALGPQARRLADWMDAQSADGQLSLDDVSRALAAGPSRFEHRLVVDATTMSQAPVLLRQAADQVEGTGTVSADGAIATGRRVEGRGPVFVLPGQGSQWDGMGAALLDESPVFRAAVDDCARAFGPELGYDLAEALRAPMGGGVESVQPLLFTMMIGLARVWEAHGVRPAAVIGASLGEPAALCIAGALSLDDAATVSLRRARILARSQGDLAMLVCQMSREAAEELIEEVVGGTVEVLVQNSASSIVVGGDRGSVESFATRLEEDGVWTRWVKDAAVASHSSWIEPLRSDFVDELSGITAAEPRIPVYSATTGGRLDTAGLQGEFWFENTRGMVRLHAATRAAMSDGFMSFVQCSPHPGLNLPLQETAAELSAEALVLPTVHRGDGGRADFRRSYIRYIAHAERPHTQPVGPSRPLALPTYAFDVSRYFELSTDPDLTGSGFADSDHPLLTGSVSLAGDGGAVFLGEVSLIAQPWLAGHKLDGQVLLPGAAIVELALSAGGRLGADTVDEVVLSEAVPVPEDGARPLQVILEAPQDDEGRRGFSLWTRAGDTADEDWVLHASGTLSRGGEDPASVELPSDPTEVADSDAVYVGYADRGMDYSGPFRSLDRVMRDADGAVWAEAVLPPADRIDRFLLHPALMDAAFHGLSHVFGASGAAGVPFAFSGVRIHADQAAHLHVKLEALGDSSASVHAFDPSGDPVLTIERMTVRSAAGENPAGSSGRRAESLFTVRWEETEALSPDDADASQYAGKLLHVRPTDGSAVQVAAECASVVARVQEWLDGDSGVLTVLTRNSDPTGGVPVDPGAAAVAGLIRTAMQEHPGRLRLIDGDGSVKEPATIVPEDVPESLVRAGAVLRPRLAAHRGPVESVTFDEERTALITGGGAIGAVLAQRLVTHHGVRRVLIASRSGAESDANRATVEALESLGAVARAVPVDLTDPGSVARLIADVPTEHPVGVVVHTAGVLDDGVIDALDDARLRRALAPKLGAVQNLAAALDGIRPELFVVCSSAAGMFGPPGQANYAAANAALDAWCAARTADGHPTLSLAWGPWDASSTRASDAAGTRTGLAPFDGDSGARAFSEALGADAGPVVAPLLIDRPTLRRQVDAGVAQPLLAGLVEPRRALPVRRAAAADAERGTSLDAMTDLVAEVVGAVLGYGPGDEVDEKAAFRALGIDSLTALQVRNRLAEALDLRLPVSLVFDHPTIQALARFLHAQTAEAPADDAAGEPEPVAERTPDDERIAIVSMACRFPGGVDSPEALWDLVEQRRSAVGRMPTDRGWDLDRLVDPTGTRPGTSLVDRGAFIDDPYDFDPALFALSPREALAMDPVQRLSLEVAWEALESAHIRPDSLAGSRTGVYLGVMYQDYASRFEDVPQELQAYVGNGSAPSVASGRISYTFGLNGPALTLDTACSSSLVAVHLACRALLAGEADLALAGGGTVMSTPELFINFSGIRGISSDGACRSFSEGADGAGLGEGVGIIALERLSDARRNGREVLAVIEGSAVNQDGASNGLTAPNGPAQQDVIRRALAAAGLQPGAVDLVEAHGTGTPLGDPIEVQAIAATYGAARPADDPVRVGTVKSNIAHTQAAAGIAGLMKAVGALQHRTMPPTIGATPLSTRIDWDGSGVAVLTEERPWQREDGPLRAGVSAFGISGTNAHVIVGEAPVPVAPAEEAVADPGTVGTPVDPRSPAASDYGPVIVTGMTEAAVLERSRLLADALEGRLSDEPLSSAAHALVRRQAQLPHRAVVAGDRHTVAAGLRAPTVHRSRRTRTVFHFTGQGSQSAQMGSGLRLAVPQFASAIDEVADILAEDGTLPADLRDVMAEPGSGLATDPVYGPLAIFAYEYAQSRVLASVGIRPDAVIGHSLGMIAAAQYAGVLELSDAVLLVLARSRLMAASAPGAMIALAAPENVVRERLAVSGSTMEIAAVNGAESTVVSGPAEDVDTVLAHVTDVRSKRLDIVSACHSRLMDPAVPLLTEFASGLTHHSPTIPVVSNLDGRPLEEFSGDTWAQFMREPVRYAEGLSWLRETGHHRHIEVGPAPHLTPLVREAAPEDAVIPLAGYGGPGEEASVLAEGVGLIAASGVDVEWSAWFDRDTAPQLRNLPSYPFERERLWAPGTRRASAGGSPDAPLLEQWTVSAASGEMVATVRLDPAEHPWLLDHAVGQVPLLPGSLLLELVLEAGRTQGLPVLENLVLEAPALVAEGAPAHLQVVLADDGAVSLHQETDGTWQRVASGRLVTETDTAVPEPFTDTGGEPLPTADVYSDLEDGGVDYGPAFRCLVSARRDGDALVARLAPQDTTPVEGHLLHPILLDVSLHALGPSQLLDAETAHMPFEWSGVRVHVPQAVPAIARITSADGAALSIALFDADGTCVAEVRELQLRPADAGGVRPPLLQLDWVQADGDARTPAGGSEPMLYRVPRAGAGSGEIAGLLVDVAAAVRDAVHGTAERELLVVTRGGVRVHAADVVDPAHAAVVGFVRAAQNENPGALRLLDVDRVFAARTGESTPPGSEAEGGAQPYAEDDTLLDLVRSIPAASQQAVRDGEVFVPQLRPLALEPQSPTRSGTALVVGGGGVAAGLAGHLVATGVTRIHLASRRGALAPGTDQVLADLREAGAEAHAHALDATDRRAIGDLLAEIGQPDVLVHTAAVLRDALVDGVTRSDLRDVLAPKTDAVDALLDAVDPEVVQEVVLFSSAAGVVGSAGQSGYSAANQAMDALAVRHRARGLPVTSVAWGRWGESAGAADTLDAQQEEAQDRSGMRALTDAQAFAAFDAAVATGEPALAAFGYDRRALRLAAADGLLPVVLSGLAGHRASAAAPADRHDLAGLTGAERRARLEEIVRTALSAVLGLQGTLPPLDQRLGDAGFDSLMAIEVRNRLATATGVSLRASLVFDHETVADLVGGVEAAVADSASREAVPAEKRERGTSATIGDLYQSALSSGRWETGFELLRLAAELRPTFEAGEDRIARTVALNASVDGPMLFAFHSCIATAGAAQYAKLGSVLASHREVVGVSLPGFDEGEPLPASVDAVVIAQTEAVLRDAGARPVILMGTSAGGWFAQAVAEELVRRGRSVDAVVLIDVYLPQSDFLDRFGVALMDGMTERSETYRVDDDAPLTAMGWYTRLMGGWEPQALDVPTLFVQAEDPLSSQQAGADESWRATWPLPHDLVRTTGNHFTLMETECRTTVDVVDEWLRAKEDR